MARRLSDHEKVEAVIYAAAYGDEAAASRFGVSERSLYNFRALCREEHSPLAEIFRRYAEALSPQHRAATFADWLLSQIAGVSEVLMQKAATTDGRNPETLRALNEHIGVLLDHKAALDYIARLFGPAADEADGEGADGEEA